MLRAVYMCHTQFARQVKNKHKSAGMFVKTQSTKYAHHLAAPCLPRNAVRRVASSLLRATAVCGTSRGTLCCTPCDVLYAEWHTGTSSCQL